MRIPAVLLALLLASFCWIATRPRDTKLHAAASRGDAAAVRSLLEDGGNPNARNREQETPLHLAASQGDLASVDALVAADAAIDPRSEGGSDAHANYPDATPLHYALWNAHSEVAAYLIQHGADVNALADEMRTPLGIAALRNDVVSVRVLLAHGADCMLASPLYHGAVGGGADAVREILAASCGADQDVVLNGEPAICAAIRAGHPNVVAALIEFGADVEVVCQHRYLYPYFRPLHVAAYVGDAEGARLLLAAGASREARVEGGTNAPSWLPEIVCFGMTALEIAKHQQHDAVVSILEE